MRNTHRIVRAWQDRRSIRRRRYPARLVRTTPEVLAERRRRHNGTMYSIQLDTSDDGAPRGSEGPNGLWHVVSVGKDEIDHRCAKDFKVRGVSDAVARRLTRGRGTTSVGDESCGCLGIVVHLRPKEMSADSKSCSRRVLMVFARCLPRCYNGLTSGTVRGPRQEVLDL